MVTGANNVDAQRTFYKNPGSEIQARDLLLSVHAGHDVLEWALIDYRHHVLGALYTAECTVAMADGVIEKLLEKHEPGKVMVCSDFGACALLPIAHVDENRLDQLLAFIATPLRNTRPVFDRLVVSPMAVAYAQPENWLYKATRASPVLSSRHIVTVMLEAWQRQTRLSSTYSVFVHLQGSRFVLGLYQQNQLLLCNSFDTGGIDDVAYYTLFAIEQHGLNPKECQLVVSGSSRQLDHTAVTKSLESYIPLADRYSDPGIPEAPGLSEEIARQFAPVINQTLCAS